ncbi:MAG: FAD-dependent oxidoreductase [Acidobacteria bacterium]|nr:FAD-dependent oxidoreductase [Acidobacteriota bacterium]
MSQSCYELQAPDATTYWTQMIKCQDACPVHTDACGYVTAIAEGRDADAYRIARASNPFASICGRICGAPCEANCRRGAVDHPVAIRALKRFVCDSHGPESGERRLHQEACDERLLPPDRGGYERVAVVGAGVAGLTVAHDLARLGYKVTVFEAHSEPGGMLTVGVPIFRLPRDLVRREIDAILSLGIELRCNMRLGHDFLLSDLRQDGYAAIFLGIGLPKGRRLQIRGAEHPNVYDGLDFLRSFNEGAPLPLGKRVVVIGGGNVAYDVARSAIRPIDESSSGEAVAELGRGERTAYDVARSALRLSGGREVHLVCLEKRHEMPADEREIVEGAEEGLTLHNGQGPKEVVIRDGTLVGLRTVHCTSVFDQSGRFNPTFDESQTDLIGADTILFAVGQTSDLSFLAPSDGVATDRGLIKVNPETYQTSSPDVFACGDIAHGPKLFIHAIASAQIAARSMHDYLRRTRTDVVTRQRWIPASYSMIAGWEVLERTEPSVIGVAQRVGSSANVESRYTEADARRQASRCLRCNINTVFNTSICVGCNGCVDVCPRNVLRLVGLSRLASDNHWQTLASEALGITEIRLRSMPPHELDALGAVMLKDESSCIRCAMCASRCPTHAVTMERFDFYRECVSVPGANPRIVHQPPEVRP